MKSLNFRPSVWLTLLSVMFLCSSAGADYTRVQEYIDKGDLEKARAATASIINQNYLDQEGAYYQGMLQSDAQLAIADLQKALQLCTKDCEEILGQLAAAYYGRGDYKRVVQLYRDNDDKLDDHSKTFRMYWFAALSYLRLGEYDKAEDIIKKTSRNSKEQEQWGQIMRANAQYLKNDKKDARNRLNDVISAGRDPAQAALYNRTYFYAQDKSMDMALTGFTMLKDERDGFLGSDDLLRLLEGGSGVSSDGSAEKVAGVRYTIQIGTFAERSEGADIANSLKKDGWSIFERTKYVDGKKYWIVSVGAFATVEKAQRSKKILENKLSASLQVVILE